MSDEVPWYKERAFIREKKDWYAKLKAEGFYDIEGGVEGHLLVGPTPSRRFHVVKEQVSPGAKVDVHQILSAEEDIVNFMDNAKGNYHSLVQLLVAQAFRMREPVVSCWIWLLHSHGVGERAICREMGYTPSVVARHVKTLKRSVNARLTAFTNCGKVDQ
jgi:hypothetical protein